MDLAAFPQLSRIEYGEAATALGLANGLQLRIFYNAVVLGNSSTALTGGFQWRSLPRQAYTIPGGPGILYTQYVGNHLYVYPEHRDHDIDHFGDVYPTNTPYLVTSQGSSGSDRPFLDAIACTLAAFQPALQQWHDFFASAVTTSANSDEDDDGLPLWWEQANALSPTLKSADGDEDRDGLSNLLEFALNQSTTANSSLGLPTVGSAINPDDGLRYLTLTYLHRTDAPWLTYAVEVSSDLVTWNSGPANSQPVSAVVTGDGVTEIVTVRGLPAMDTGGRFVRLRVTN
jgi:hypothetical protein